MGVPAHSRGAGRSRDQARRKHGLDDPQGGGDRASPRRQESSWAEFLRAQAASILECDFLTVDTLFLKRFYILFFMELSTRRVHLAGITTRPDGRWATQQARNLLMKLDDEDVRPRFLVRDRDSKFTRDFDEVFRCEGIRVIKAPVRAPKARAHAGRWVGSVRRECLDRLLIASRRHLQHTLTAYVAHYNERRPHRALEQQPPAGEESPREETKPRRDRPRSDPSPRPTRRTDPRVSARRVAHSAVCPSAHLEPPVATRPASSPESDDARAPRFAAPQTRR